MKLAKIAAAIAVTTCLFACNNKDAEHQTHELLPQAESRLNIYQEVTLSADLSHLSDNQRTMLSILIDASKIMDELFWQQAFGDNKAAFLASIKDPATKRFVEINYGPWDRLQGDKPFLSNIDVKPMGAQFYPADMSKDEFDAADFAGKESLYSVVRRNQKGQLYSLPYSEAYAEQLERAAALLKKAATYAEDTEFANYLNMRAEAFLNDNYQPSDFAWMDMKNNPIDVVIGPIETYEDLLYGYRAGFESYVLVKDLSWSERLAKYAEHLPSLQKGLPVSKKYKAETPGADADLNAYDVIYYAGHSNAGSKTIAINLPNDEQVQLQKGTRRLQLKNAMRAKFDTIMLPIADTLVSEEDRKHVTFTAFFANTMFHEVAHGLGIKNTINKKGTVRSALKEHASALEEGKADILGLYMVRQLLKKKVITEGELKDYYTTFMAGIFRSVRFGASSAHGKANMVRFNYFADQGAFTKDEQGFYRVDMDKMSKAIDSLSKLILTLQGDGDYQGVATMVKEMGIIRDDLAADLAKLEAANIPVDIVFKQGKRVLDL
ncbi:Zn-dependent hydrolase [Thalassotalea sp. HSM 43]|uniref:dipeptidyl-peptidase 3 family protein n=1 Tax=Thalassotalea sp. HSM 43 TaxID=2552945 RepID=UPI001080C51B|nr:Zn-dependent hydrolase [Thalassotalea sp. HSM 43]QBY03496.1 Zn-dependent hydrolase [Thalassotalea sp. HSM 43]